MSLRPSASTYKASASVDVASTDAASDPASVDAIMSDVKDGAIKSDADEGANMLDAEGREGAIMSLRPCASTYKASVDLSLEEGPSPEDGGDAIMSVVPSAEEGYTEEGSLGPSPKDADDIMSLRPCSSASVDADEGRRAREDEKRKEERLPKRQRSERLMNYQALLTSARRKFEDALALRNNVPATSEHTGQATVLIVKLLASTHTVVRQQTREALPMLRWLLNLNDDNILKDTCKVLSRLTDGTDDIQVVNDGLYLRLLKLSSNQPSLRPPAFHKVGEILAGDDLPTQSLIDADIFWTVLRLMKDSNSKLLEKEVLPFLKEKLISSEDKNVLREACWVLSYISDDIDDIQAIILDTDLCRNLVVKLLRDSSESVLYPALRTVSNIFAGCTVTTIFPEYNDKEFQSVIGADIIWTLVDLMKVKDDISCRLEKGLLLFLKKILINSTDEDALRVACTALSYMSDHLYIVKGMFDAVVRGRLVVFLRGSSDCILYPALRTVSNIFNGSYHLIEGMIKAGALPALVKILKEDFWEYIKLEACVAILNISRSDDLPGLTKSVISAGIIPPLNLLLTNAPLRTRVQVAHAFYYMTDGESGCHTESLVKDGCMEALCKALSYSDPIVVIFCLRGVENILKDGKFHSGSENSYVKAMKKFKGFEEISKLEGDGNKKISRIAVSIGDMYCGVKGCQLT